MEITHDFLYEAACHKEKVVVKIYDNIIEGCLYCDNNGTVYLAHNNKVYNGRVCRAYCPNEFKFSWYLSSIDSPFDAFNKNCESSRVKFLNFQKEKLLIGEL
jgi:hypothetical protein